MPNLKSVFSRVQGDLDLIQNMPFKHVNKLYKARKTMRGENTGLDLLSVPYIMPKAEAIMIIKQLTGKRPCEKKTTIAKRTPSFI